MKAIGIVRKVDILGRIVLPTALLRDLVIRSGDYIEMYIEDQQICILKYNPKCYFCGNEGVKEFKEKHICLDCLDELKNKYSCSE
jgi:AbrB family transcriptional regulator, transcriptional pleiotropic regulator of transition state genes